ncbi:MAG: DUF421 domain-containing protein [Thermomicrobiales bacterium]
MSFDMLFQSWGDLVQTLAVGVLAYLALIVLLRVSGKRTLSKMNAFDLVVTVALGSTLATVLLSEDVALAEGIVAFAVLIGLQLVLTWTSYRSGAVSNMVKASPALLFYEGAYLEEAMRRERVLASEVRAAIREQGHGSIELVKAVVLETDGSFSVIGGQDAVPNSALEGVRGEKPAT